MSLMCVCVFSHLHVCCGCWCCGVCDCISIKCLHCDLCPTGGIFCVVAHRRCRCNYFRRVVFPTRGCGVAGLLPPCQTPSQPRYCCCHWIVEAVLPFPWGGLPLAHAPGVSADCCFMVLRVESSESPASSPLPTPPVAVVPLPGRFAVSFLIPSLALAPCCVFTCVVAVQ